MPAFENNTSAASYYLELVNSADCEEPLRTCEPNIIIEFEPFILTHSEDKTFEDEIITRSFIKDIAKTSSDKINEK